MSKEDPSARAVTKHSQISVQQKQTRKEQVLIQGRSAISRSIADAIPIKIGNIYFLSQPNGDVPLGGEHGLGLYYHDCRYLCGYQFRLADTYPIVLVGASTKAGKATFELTNPELELSEGEHLPTGEIGISWERTLDARQILLSDQFHIINYSQRRVEFTISLSFEADFEDIFAVRGLLSERPGKFHPPRWEQDNLIFRYEGADGRDRGLRIHFLSPPQETGPATSLYRVALDAQGSQDISIQLIVSETDQKPGLQTIPGADRDTSADWLADLPKIRSDSLLFNQILECSFQDLQSLRSSIHRDEYFAAGIPWFTTLFGRDSLITALQMLALNPQIAAETLRLLASYQAHAIDRWRDAQPGKILHELRCGELAALGEIPHSPYYGTVDATPLFLILMVDYIQWTGDLKLFDELKEAVDLALRWIDEYGDSNGDGYVDYQSASEKGLINQGWKDSGNAIINADGSLARQPIALVEVQGYVYRAKIGLAGLYERTGQAERGKEMRRGATELRSRFNRDFWREELGTYLLALQAQGDPVAIVSSNAGQALWAGIADTDKARRTTGRLLAKDMFSGWGIRTISQNEKGFNPIGYHLGTVWPHDTALIAAGMRNYGFDREGMQIFSGILEAAINFKEFRLPELFSGFSREEYSTPVQYPVACHPQAWAAGSIPFLMCTFLGLEADALEHRLEICRPMLPETVNSLEVSGIRVGEARVDLEYTRTPDGATAVHVSQVQGNLEVSVVVDQESTQSRRLRAGK